MGCVNMWRKCKNCGKWFNVGAFSVEHCPYCGQVLDDNSRKKIRNREYFWKRTIFIILGCVVLGIILIAIIAKYT